MDNRGRMFRLHSIGPTLGDCTTPYGINFNKQYQPITVLNFVEYILANRSKDWGTIYVSTDPKVDSPGRASYYKCDHLEYKYGTLIDAEKVWKFLDKYENYLVIDGGAHGGWSRMDFCIVVKEPDESKDR